MSNKPTTPFQVKDEPETGPVDRTTLEKPRPDSLQKSEQQLAWLAWSLDQVANGGADAAKVPLILSIVDRAARVKTVPADPDSAASTEQQLLSQAREGEQP